MSFISAIGTFDQTNFISFTSSLLSALHRAGWLDRKDRKNVQIAVLVTFQLPDMANISPAVFLLYRFAVQLDPILNWDVDEEFLVWASCDLRK